MKFSGYYFYTNTNTQGDFRICISLPLIEHFIFKNHAQNEAGRIVPDLFLLFKKALNEVEVWSAA